MTGLLPGETVDRVPLGFSGADQEAFYQRR
jgi:hypothetical protein